MDLFRITKSKLREELLMLYITNPTKATTPIIITIVIVIISYLFCYWKDGGESEKNNFLNYFINHVIYCFYHSNL